MTVSGSHSRLTADRRSAWIFDPPLNVVLLVLVGLTIVPARADENARLAPQFLDVLPARPLGPANMGGRIVDFAVVADQPDTIYVAAASGGLWKTTNGGTTWEPVFDAQATPSLGAVAVAPSNPDVVWVGTGEANARNSVSWGNGVYLLDATAARPGSNVGLDETHHIGRIIVHPSDPDIVYVAALGHLWGPNHERGVFKTDRRRQDLGSTC